MEDKEHEHEDEEHDSCGCKAKLPNLDDFGFNKNYKHSIHETKEFFQKHGDLTGPFFKSLKGKKN